MNTGHESPTCYLHFTLWRCLCAWKSSQFWKKVSFTHDDAVEINQANQTSQWPHLCFWKSNMKCLHWCSHLQPDKLPSTLQSVKCPEANLISPEFWTLLIATSNIKSNVPIRSAGTHQVIWPWHFVTLKTRETQWKREKSLQLYLLQLEEFGLPQPWMPSRTDESSPDSTCCSPEREAQSLGDLGFGKSAPQTECDHMDETDCVAAIRIGKGHLFFSRSVQTSPQECHTVAQGSSKNKKKKKKKK